MGPSLSEGGDPCWHVFSVPRRPCWRCSSAEWSGYRPRKVGTSSGGHTPLTSPVRSTPPQIRSRQTTSTSSRSRGGSRPATSARRQKPTFNRRRSWWVVCCTAPPGLGGPSLPWTPPPASCCGCIDLRRASVALRPRVACQVGGSHTGMMVTIAGSSMSHRGTAWWHSTRRTDVGSRASAQTASST